MKLVVAAVGIAGLGVVTFAYLATHSSTATAPSATPVTKTVVTANSEDSARLAQQVEELQRSLIAMKSQLASQQSQLAAQRPASANDAKPTEPESVEAQRAADAERRRVYMAGVAQAFGNEKLDPVWANQASTRVSATFEGNEGLRNIAHTVECRQQTCRVQIDDDGSGRLARSMPFLALGLADVLPSVSAEHIDQPNGRGAMVLYMSSQRLSADTAQRR
jgi:hypothetical protein